jgi:hypothetical protein
MMPAEGSNRKPKPAPATVSESAVSPMETSRTKKVTETKETKASSSERPAVTQVQGEIVSPAMGLEPEGKDKRSKSKSPKVPRVPALPALAPLAPVPPTKSPRKRSTDRVPTPQGVAVETKRAKSPARPKVA